MTKSDEIKIQCWNNAMQTFGYSYIFSRRARFYAKWLRVLTLLGILVPLIIGTAATGYGTDSNLLKSLIWVSVPLSIFQITISAFALVNKWEDMSSYSLEAVANYDMLSEKFRSLAKIEPENEEDILNLIKEFDNLNSHYNYRSQQDVKYLITEREKRIGMRWALRDFQRQCAACHEVPVSMESTECPVCGQFKKTLISKIIYHG
ncbi:MULTISPECIES: mobilome CxxCx(11)CxxC protein [Sphingobacterium]|uniref:mobilome CxxCx(11)CxxC protein n=1 Tax=Sphingobacterium TaxID=28453 RepID=UPI00258088E5|nr:MULTISPECIES: mobilome CxxCx(11)CxxC protein [Sphingobacterium]